MELMLGGSATNTSAGICSLKIDTYLFTVMGSDEDAYRLFREVRNKGIKTHYINHINGKSGRTIILLGGSPRQIAYAAEMGPEHPLILTCDPMLGYVQIPCIERNAHAALRALDCAHFTFLSDGSHRISFDNVVQVMMETGEAMSRDFEETSKAGLAKIYQLRIMENINKE